MVKDVAYVAYAVADVARARAFYQDVVGLRPAETFGDQFVEFAVGGTTFAVDGEPPDGTAPGSCSGVAFEVDDVDAMRAHLVAHGVAVTDVYDSPVCRFAFANDPEGNRFGVHERKRSPERP